MESYPVLPELFCRKTERFDVELSVEGSIKYLWQMKELSMA